jgi:hypothetical protein
MTSHAKRPRDPLAPDAGSAAPSATAGDALDGPFLTQGSPLVSPGFPPIDMPVDPVSAWNI